MRIVLLPCLLGGPTVASWSACSRAPKAQMSFETQKKDRECLRGLDYDV